MAGVLASHKTLSKIKVPNRRYPEASTIPSLVERLSLLGAWPVVHYNTSGCKDPLSQQLNRVLEAAPGVQGIQMNVVKPSRQDIETFRDRHPAQVLILQVNRSSIQGKSPEAVWHYIEGYADLVDFALLDLSGGRGTPLDPVWASQILQGWPFPTVRPGVAGGLGPGCKSILEAMAPGVGGYAGISFDAEGNLRVPVVDPLEGESYQDELSKEKALGYFEVLQSLGGT
jgi:hypothetical protein